MKCGLQIVFEISINSHFTCQGWVLLCVHIHKDVTNKRQQYQGCAETIDGNDEGPCEIEYKIGKFITIVMTP